jgi:hypothetical protein
MTAMDLLSDSGSAPRSLIISASELTMREGMKLEKGVNFRDDSSRPAVLLSLPREDGYTDEWREDTTTYIYEGHDSVAEGAAGSTDDQLLMYASGKPTENGKFYKAANEFKDGIRKEALMAQVYEKIDAGVYFDKGIFELVAASYASDGTRKVCKLALKPVDADLPEDERVSWDERMLPASKKAEAWKQGAGRCVICGEQSGLHFTSELRCAAHFT